MTLDNCQVFVTGGTGLLGRSIVRRLVATARQVRMLSRTGGYPGYSQVSMHRGNLASLEDLRTAMKGCDAVFHCAAEKTDRKRMTAVNVHATRMLFELARDLRIKLFCHLSSVGVVGKTHLSVVDESAPCNPMNLYEETKLVAEEIVRQGLGDGHLVILRPTNIFGAETLRPWLENSLRARMRLFVKGNEMAHLVYVEDVAAAATHWLNAPLAERVDTFIVSSDEEPGGTCRDVQAELASRIDGAPRPLKASAPLFVPYCARLMRHGSANSGDVVYSSRKLRQAGFQFPFGRQAGLLDAAGSLLQARSHC